MNRVSVHRRRRSFGKVVGVFASCWGIGWAASAHADMACVRCGGPDQTYRCQAVSHEAIPAEALRYFCISQIARDHVHQSCAVLRGTSSCEGVEVSYAYQNDAAHAPLTAGANPAGQQVNPAGEPATLKEMTRDTVQASVKAGKAIGDATKRALRCLGSALTGC